MSSVFGELQQCLASLCIGGDVVVDKNENPFKDEKSRSRDPQEVASEIVTLLSTADRNDIYLGLKIKNAITPGGEIHTASWAEAVAQYVLAGVESLIKTGAQVSDAMRKAIDKAVEEAKDFAKDHPVYFTLIAFGVLLLLSPAILEVLGFVLEAALDGVGFARIGIRAASIAARWQARYSGYVPKGSLFSFLQRLGMVGVAPKSTVGGSVA